MNERKRFLLLIIIMVTVCLSITGISMHILYNTALNEERGRLTETAESQARLIEAIASFDAVYNKDYPEGPFAATLRQIKDAHKSYSGFGNTGEFTLARREGEQIVFLLSHRHSALNSPTPVPFSKKLAEPMKLALSGKSGTIIGLDYRGEKVLAAHEPLKKLNLGIVAKIDMAEIQAPFIRAAKIVFGFTLLFVFSGTSLFLRIGKPIFRKLDDQENALSKKTEKLTGEIKARKQAEKALSQREEMLRLSSQKFMQFFNHMPEYAFIVSLEGAFVDVNNAALKVLGYERDELIGKQLSTIYSQESLEKMKKLFACWKETGQIKNEEMIIVTKMGERRTVLLNVGTVMDGSGNSLHSTSVQTDITERKQYEKKLKWNAHRDELLSNTATRLLQSNDPQGLVEELCSEVLDFLGCQVFFNFLADKPSGRLYLNACAGIPGDEALKIKWLDYGVAVCGCVARDRVKIIAEDILNADDTDTALVKSYGINAYCCHPLLVQDQLIGTLSFGSRLKPRFSEDEIDIMATVTNLVAMAMYRIETEKALKESETKLKKVLETIPMGVWIMDKEGKIIYGNPFGQKIWQGIRYVSPDEYYQYKAWWVKSGKKIAPDEWAAVRAIKNKEESHAEEIEIECFDGTHKHILNWAVPITDENGRVEGAIALNQDVSDWVKTEKEKEKLTEQLFHSHKMEAIGTLAGGIAHDFNNMLGVIVGNLSFAMATINKDDDLFEVLSDVQKGANQAKSLTQQLLTFSRGGTPIKEIMNINQLIIESADFVSRGTGSICEFSLDESLWPVEVDSGQFNQVVSNIVINAIQSMPHGGIIKLLTENVKITTNDNLPVSEGKYVKIIIEDKGMGISKKHLSKIFDPYFSTKQKGSGLGLATSFSIVKKHGGHITVYSELDKGTVFYIYLPASEGAVKKIEFKEEVNHQGHGKILVMDDQSSILKMVKRMLTRMGYDAICVSDGLETIKVFREAHLSDKPFDLVILDLTVPGGMGGAQTVTELLKIDPKVRAIASSGYSNDPVMANPVEYGFLDIAPKPYTKDQLSTLLNKIERDA